MKFPFVSVIVVNYNLKKFLEPLLKSLLETDYPHFEILFVDNASTDGSIDLIERKFHDPRLKVIPFERNWGLYKAGNMAVKHARGEHLAFLDADVKVTPSWLRELVKVMIESDNVGAVQCEALNMENPDLIDNVGVDKDGDHHGEKSEEYTAIREILYPTGMGWLIKKAVMEKMGGFDDDFFIEQGDVDLGWRLWLYGYRCLCVPTSVIYHAHGTLRKKKDYSKLFQYHRHKNRLCLYLKVFERANLLKIIPLIVTFYILYSIVRKDIEKTKAMMWVIKNLKSVLHKRKIIQYNRKISDDRIRPLFIHLFSKWRTKARMWGIPFWL